MKLSRQVRHADCLNRNKRPVAKPTGFVGTGMMAEREANAGKINSMKKTLTILGLAILSLAFTGCTSVRDAVPATQITGSVGGKPFSFTGPKDLALDTLHIEAKPDGSVALDVKGLNARTNPDVITTTGDAQAKLIAAQGKAITDALTAGGAAAGAALGAAAK